MSKLFNPIYVRLYLVQCREVTVNVLLELPAYAFLQLNPDWFHYLITDLTCYQVDSGADTVLDPIFLEGHNPLKLVRISKGGQTCVAKHAVCPEPGLLERQISKRIYVRFPKHKAYNNILAFVVPIHESLELAWKRLVRPEQELHPGLTGEVYLAVFHNGLVIRVGICQSRLHGLGRNSLSIVVSAKRAYVRFEPTSSL